MALITLMGSGEISPTMVKVHRKILEQLGPDPSAVFLDTPFGFQENADVLTDRVAEYFRVSLDVDIIAPTFRGRGATPYEAAAMLEAVRQADYVFAGPGSPSYALEHWQNIGLRDAIGVALAHGAALTLASAAAVTSGTHAVPVYEIYKVGAEPHWLPGLDVLGLVGLSAVVIPHFDNAEGGNHDTRFCYLGRRRFDQLRSELTVPVLGIDEHTAVVIDDAERTISVHGKGSATVVSGSGATEFPAGSSFPFEEVSANRVAPSLARRPSDEQSFDAALAAGDAAQAAGHILDADDERSRAAMVVRLAEAADRGLVPRSQQVAPFVDLALELRDSARARSDYALADRIRDRLLELGIEIHDSPEGTDWQLED